MTKMIFSVICTTLVTILIIMSMAMNAKKHRFGGCFAICYGYPLGWELSITFLCLFMILEY